MDSSLFLMHCAVAGMFMLMLLQVRKRNGSEKELDVNRPVKKIMSPVEAYLDDRGARKVSTGLPVNKSCV